VAAYRAKHPHIFPRFQLFPAVSLPWVVMGEPFFLKLSSML